MIEHSIPKDAKELIAQFKTRPEAEWVARGEAATLALFHAMAERVPAYRQFLKENAFDASSVRTIEDFKKVPLASKDNYLLKYSLKDLSWDGRFSEGQWTIASTSGSTGEPFYFPRTVFQDEQFGVTAEACLVDFFGIGEKTTLFIDCFALGVWIGGMFMYQAVKYIIDSGKYNISVITPGADKTEAVKAVKNLAPLFGQVIIGGYAPLVKDLIDDGIRAGVSWQNYDMKYFFAAEGFTEGLRDYIARKGGVKDIYQGTMNQYGTADLGTMAHETPMTILSRRLALERGVLRDVFGDDAKQPTVTQYVPELFYFEDVNGRLACSARGGLPLARYDLKDRGAVKSFAEIESAFQKKGIDFMAEARALKIDDKKWQLPFVYLYERDDLTVSIYSVNIYPESIRKTLEARELEDELTGKFHMSVDYDEGQNQFLQIVIEMKEGVAESEPLAARALQAVIDRLNAENSEWRDFYADAGIRDKVIPRIVLRAYQDPTYFRPGRKQQWVKRQKK